MKKHRSWLFIPGINERMLQKAKSIPTDVIIYDLEDSVELSSKEAARDLIKKQIKDSEADFPYSLVRINAYGTPFFDQDLESLVEPNLFGFMIPKSEHPDFFKKLDVRLSELEQKMSIEKGQVKIIPLIETALGVNNSFEIASSSKRIIRLAFGAVDYIKDIQGALTDNANEELLYARGKIANDSYAAKIGGPIDTVFTNLNDMEGFIKETKNIKKMGFQGKLVIHPKQVLAVNEVFKPTDAEVREAKLIIEAYEEAIEKHLGVIQLNGKMIDIPVVEHARKLTQYYNELP